jgi:hypothetical protein
MASEKWHRISLRLVAYFACTVCILLCFPAFFDVTRVSTEKMPESAHVLWDKPPLQWQLAVGLIAIGFGIVGLIAMAIDYLTNRRPVPPKANTVIAALKKKTIEMMAALWYISVFMSFFAECGVLYVQYFNPTYSTDNVVEHGAIYVAGAIALFIILSRAVRDFIDERRAKSKPS